MEDPHTPLLLHVSANPLTHSGFERAELQVASFRKWLWAMLSVKSTKYGKPTTYWPSRIFEIGIIALILLNVSLALAASDENLTESPVFSELIEVTTWVSLVIFTSEYVARIWSCVESEGAKDMSATRARIVWALKPLSVLDVIALIPFYLDSLELFNNIRALAAIRFLRLIRAVQVVRMERQTKSFKVLGQVLRSRAGQLFATIFVAIILMVVSATVMYFFENQRQPDVFSSIMASMWWSTTALTTVGYGDMIPKTIPGKVVAGVSAVVGIGLVALPAGIISSGFVEVMEREREEALLRQIKEATHLTGRSPRYRRRRKEVQPASTDSATVAVDPDDSDTELSSNSDVSFVGGVGGMAVCCPHCNRQINLQLAAS